MSSARRPDPPRSSGSTTWGRSPTARRSSSRRSFAAAPGRRGARHACCCSSTPRSTRSGAAPAPRSCRSAGAVAGARDRGARERPRRARHLPRARAAGRLSDLRGRRRGRVRALAGGGDRDRARAGRPRRARAAPRTGPTTPACGSAERKIASIGVHVAAGRHHARPRRQRQQRPRAVQLDHPLRPAGVQMTSLAAGAADAGLALDRGLPGAAGGSGLVRGPRSSRHVRLAPAPRRSRRERDPLPREARREWTW